MILSLNSGLIQVMKLNNAICKYRIGVILNPGIHRKSCSHLLVLGSADVDSAKSKILCPASQRSARTGSVAIAKFHNGCSMNKGVDVPLMSRTPSPPSLVGNRAADILPRNSTTGATIVALINAEE